MITKLVLCYELALDKLDKSRAFIKQALNLENLDCVHVSELEDFDFQDTHLYSFHLDLNKELETHSHISTWAQKNNVDQLNPFYHDKNIFDDKYLFAQFCLSSAIKHPQTKLVTEFEALSSGCVKPRHGTENKDNDDYSDELLKKILSYDDALWQEKIEIKEEYKVLFLNGALFADKDLADELQAEIKSFIDKLMQYFKQQSMLEPRIFSIDILENQNSGIYFLEINLRPGALYRFSHLI